MLVRLRIFEISGSNTEVFRYFLLCMLFGEIMTTPFGSSHLMQTNDLGPLSNDFLPDIFGNKKPKAYGGNAIETFGDSLMPHEIFIGLI